MKQNTRMTTLGLALAGVMVALVMISNYISIPTAFSRLHVANAVCMLAGMMFGGLRGGIIAGLGSALFDLTFPAYAPEAWVTFLTKGLMTLVAGLFVNHRKNAPVKMPTLLIGSFLGVITYIVLYLSKSYIQMRWVVPVPVETIPAALLGKLSSSAINGLFAIIVAPLLYSALMPGLKAAGLTEALKPNK
ncbi:MAG: ECF transporter S component [Bacillota bacterium]|nr:ECF transporter S component [Bacillota bacterium]